MLYAEKPTYLVSTEILTLMKPLPMLLIHLLPLFSIICQNIWKKYIDLALNSELIKQ